MHGSSSVLGLPLVLVLPSALVAAEAFVGLAALAFAVASLGLAGNYLSAEQQKLVADSVLAAEGFDFVGSYSALVGCRLGYP